jgi:hypothetical protein
MVHPINENNSIASKRPHHLHIIAWLGNCIYSSSIFTLHYKKRAEANTLREEKKGEQLRTEGCYGDRAEDWEEEGSEGVEGS